MSVLGDPVDLTMYGCPLHYIKAREVISRLELDQVIEFSVNKGDATNEVMNSLSQDGQECTIKSEDELTTTISVRKQR